MHTLKVVLINLPGELAAETETRLSENGAAVDATFPDADAALGGYTVPPGEKRLFVFGLRGAADVPALARLADGYPGHAVLALTAVQDPGLLVAATRAGATQLVALPLRPDDFHEALARTARQLGIQSSGRVVVVTGVTEGTGATTLALNLAAEAGRLGAEQTLLAEIGPRIGRLAVILGVTPEYTTADLLSDSTAVDLDGLRKAVTVVRPGLSILAAPYQAVAMKMPPLSSVLSLLTAARRAADLVVVDLACTYDDVYFGVMKAADDVVLVAEQKVPSVHNLMVVRDALTHQGVLARPHYVINRYSERLPGATLADIDSLLPGVRLHPIRSDGRGVMEAINMGKPLREVSPDSPVLADLGRLMESIGERPLGAPTPTHHNGWLRRGFRRLFGRD